MNGRIRYDHPPQSAREFIKGCRVGYDGRRWQPYLLTAGPKLAMSVYMTRWHRPRWGWSDPGRCMSYRMWCGSTAMAWDCRPDDVLTAGEVPDRELLCGTCEGRAIGAGYEPIGVTPHVRLHFTPRQRRLHAATAGR